MLESRIGWKFGIIYINLNMAQLNVSESEKQFHFSFDEHGSAIFELLGHSLVAVSIYGIACMILTIFIC